MGTLLPSERLGCVRAARAAFPQGGTSPPLLPRSCASFQPGTRLPFPMGYALPWHASGRGSEQRQSDLVWMMFDSGLSCDLVHEEQKTNFLVFKAPAPSPSGCGEGVPKVTSTGHSSPSLQRMRTPLTLPPSLAARLRSTL